MPWEYRVEKIKTSGMVVPNIDSLTAEDLNGGKDDWELISCIPMNRGGGILEAVYLIFKRPTPEYLSDDPRLPGNPLSKRRLMLQECLRQLWKVGGRLGTADGTRQRLKVSPLMNDRLHLSTSSS